MPQNFFVEDTASDGLFRNLGFQESIKIRK